MDSIEDYPVKDSALKQAFTRQMITKMEREDLEDKYLRLYDENIILKKYGRKRDEEIKRLSAIQIKLENDRKRLMTDHNAPRSRNSDLHNADLIEQLQNKNIQLEKQISSLKMKMMVLKHQSTGTKPFKSPIYARVNSRIDSGIAKQSSPIDPKFMKGMRAFQAPPPSQRSPVGNQYTSRIQTENIYSSNLSSDINVQQMNQLEFSNIEKRKLESLLMEQKEKLNENSQEIFALKEQLKINEFEHEENMKKLNRKVNHDKTSLVQENVDRIRLERELKEKSLKLQQLHDQYSNLEEKMRILKVSNDQLVEELENMNLMVKREQVKNITLQTEIKVKEPPKTAMLELQTRIDDLEQDREILKEANEKLMRSALDIDKEREWRKRENALKVQIAQLEATLKADVGEKGGILDRLNDERNQHDKMQEEHREMRLQYFELKHKYDQLAEQLTFFTKDSAINCEEIEEALTIVKQRRSEHDPSLNFLQKVDEEMFADSSKKIARLEGDHADTINELEKTRNMLILQYKINKEYHAEVECVNKKMEENQKEFDLKLSQYAQLLDIRADRIRKLEAQLRDVAYGTRLHRVRTDDEVSIDDDANLDTPFELQRDQNLFEIHIGKICLSENGLKWLQDNQPNIFCTWEFYEFEIQATPVLKGAKADFDFTSQYTVTVDDFFIHYLQKDSCLLEVHQSFGTDYRTVAIGLIRLKSVFDRSTGRMHGTLNLIGVEDESMCFGMLDFWIRIRIPLEQSLLLFKERNKALGYLESNLKQQRATENQASLSSQQQQKPPGNFNQLEVNVISCSNLRARNKDTQPSPYCMYQIFDYPDHDTKIVPCSNSPQFNDQKIFPIIMDENLSKYLKTQMMTIYVLDDTDSDEAAYLGMAVIPLIVLSHDKNISGSFDLNQKDGTVNGRIEISLKWKFPYIPSATIRRQSFKQGSKESSRSSPATVSLLPREEENLQNYSLKKNVAPKPRPIKQKQKFVESQDSIASTQGMGLSFVSTGTISEGSPVPGESAFLTDADLTMTHKHQPLAKKKKVPTATLR